MPKLLITGITGLIGKAVLKEILAKKLGFEITALVRPQTGVDRFASFVGEVNIIELDLADNRHLKNYLWENEFDFVVHIGALRGGRRFSRQEYLAANLLSTQQIVEYCVARKAKLLFCSSVGVFGAIPNELPANNESDRNPDNYYHFTKIECEKVINRAVLNGLSAAILRPSITYGKGDKGFPYQLVAMVDKFHFMVSNKRVWIHLCHINTISSAFVWLLENDFKPGLTLNVADREPVALFDLVNFISRQLHGKNYPPYLKLDHRLFHLGESITRVIKNELWVSRFQLISRSWFYYVRDAYELMGLEETFTIPGIQICIDDYQGKNGDPHN
ncbi:MAG: NAD-dependent epimerase/dehydratase family protein [Candidatus Cloacimonadaceae bacterium]|nr:NAD-dependent epimerase/dehydratase family protein [Candidatus Cloacimonadaceae bacterium]MDP3113185.1 NAD-dependent epimerase/dehydratase family protein [Candidatus Cloacimonadaceae bacterium]